MVDLTDLDRRCLAHRERNARVDRSGWMATVRPASPPRRAGPVSSMHGKSRSRLLPLATVLGIVTALVLTAAAMAIRLPPPVTVSESRDASAADAASRAAVARFYEAVNRAIGTGNTASLDAVLAPGYVESDSAGALVPGRDPLEHTIQALHHLAPMLRLTPESIVAEDTRAVAVVRATGGVGARFLGLPLIAPTLWNPIDVIRIVDGRIAERVVANDDGLTLDVLVQAPIDLNGPAERMVSARRFLLPPGGEHTAGRVPGIRSLAVEAGAITLTKTDAGGLVYSEGWDQPPSRWSGDSTVLASGESLLQPDGADYTARNTGAETAVLIEILTLPLSAARDGYQSEPAPAGLDTDSLGGRAQSRISSRYDGASTTTGPAILAIGRATLSPGARLTWEGAPGPTMLLVSKEGLELHTPGGRALFWRETDGNLQNHDRAILNAADGALIYQDTEAAVTNLGDRPIEVLIITMLGETR